MAEHEVWYCWRLVACVEYDVAKKIKIRFKGEYVFVGK